MIEITVLPGENVFDAVARGLNTRFDYDLDDPFHYPVYRPDVFNVGPRDGEDPNPAATVSSRLWNVFNVGPRDGEDPNPAATVSSRLWTYNVYRYI